MSWYAIDAVDRAFSRTRKALFEPFNFWKWVKFAIIIFFIGGMGSNYGGSGTNYQPGPNDYGTDFPAGPGEMPDFPSDISGLGSGYIDSVSAMAIIGAIIAFFILFILIFSYISSVMEFVFIEALVRNEVHLRAYFKKFMGKGFNLLLIRLALGLVFLILFALSLLPFIPLFLSESSDFAVPALIGGMFWFFGVVLLLALLGAVIGSFISLALPVSIYRETGILSAIRIVFRNFKKSWQEVLVYWFIRLLIGIGVGLLILILFGMLILGLASVFLIIDIILYFLLSTFLSESFIWILLLPFILVEILFIFAILLLLSVPFAVFLKYHLLSFLEVWFADANIPFFDKLSAAPETGFETGPGTELRGSEQNLLGQNESGQNVSGQGVSEQSVSGQDAPESVRSGSDGSGGSASGDSKSTNNHDF